MCLEFVVFRDSVKTSYILLQDRRTFVVIGTVGAVGCVVVGMT